METINFLYTETELSKVHLLCLKSFNDQGHTCVLWIYQHIENAPDFVEIEDAREIMPFEASIPVRQFADIFRLQLLIKVGGWWSDLDNYCLKPLNIETEYVFAGFHRATVNNNIIKAPKGSKFLRSFLASKPEKYNFEPLHENIISERLQSAIKPADYFNPLRTNLTGETTQNTYVIHLYESNNNHNSINQKILEIMAKKERKTQQSTGTTLISDVACPFSVDAENVVITFNKHFNLQYKLNKKTGKIELTTNEGKEPDFAVIKAEIEAELNDINAEFKF